MHGTLALLGLALIAAGLLFHPASPASPDAAPLDFPPHPPHADIAREYLAQNPPSWRGDFTVPNATEIRARFRRESRDPNAPVEGLTALAADPSPALRRQAMCYLAALHDPAALPTILAALKDMDAAVRRTACEVLGWNTLPVEALPLLQRLAKYESELPVRVAAVLTLTADDDNAVAVYRLGLENYWLRAECEDALARLGKLELPLPDRMYWYATQEQYEEYLKDRKVKQDLRNNGRIYFEVEEDVCSGGPNHIIRRQRFWYRAEEIKGQDM
jgi:HEAT repeat protein